MRSVDLNLMKVFVAVYEARSLTAAAQRLFVSQSAVSQSLSRLRAHFGDPLFERRKGQMEPTPVAEEVYPTLRDAMDLVESAMSRGLEFDPGASHKKFRIALSELGEIGWLGAILAEVQRTAPHITVESVALDQDLLSQWLERGFVDVAVAPADTVGDFVRTRVKDQEYALMMSTEHPSGSDTLTIDDYRSSGHAAVVGDSALHHVHEAVRREEAYVEPTVRVQRFASLPGVLTSRPDLMALVPRSIATGWARSWQLLVKSVPFEIPPVRLHVCRRGTAQSQGALAWFHDTVVRAVVTTPATFDTIHGRQTSGG